MILPSMAKISPPPAGLVLNLPPDMEFSCIKTRKETPVVAAAAQIIRKHAEAHDRVLSPHLEWEKPRFDAPGNPLSTIHPAAGKKAAIFHVLHRQRSSPEKLPSLVVGLSEDASIAKMGVGITKDCTRLSDFCGVDVKNAIDMPALVLSRKVDIGLRRGLADMSAYLLGKILRKEQQSRISRWNQAMLSEDQKR